MAHLFMLTMLLPIYVRLGKQKSAYCLAHAFNVFAFI